MIPGVPVPTTVVMLGTDVDEHRLEIAHRFGADAVFNVQRDDVATALADMTNGDGAEGHWP